MSLVSIEVKMFLLASSSGEMVTFNSKHMLDCSAVKGWDYSRAEC